MTGQKKFLFISSDYELSKTVKQILKGAKIDVIIAQNHLQGIGILDKTNAQVALVPAQSTNISGLEFAKIIREREKDSRSQKYIILYYNDQEKNEIINFSEQFVDDLIEYPFFEPELKWRVIRGFNYLEKIQSLTDGLVKKADILSNVGFFFVLESEINRIIRHNSNFSILIIYLYQFEEIVLNFGDKWKNWIEENFLKFLRSKLRIYDSIAILKENFYGIICPDTNMKELKGLDKRIRNEYVAFFRRLKELGIPDKPRISHCGISVCIKSPNVKVRDVRDLVRSWLDEVINEGLNEELFLAYEFYEHGPELVG